MKKILLTTLLFASVISTLKAQIYTPNGTIQGNSGNNNVGIGTLAPSAKLEIYNTAQAGHLLLSANDNPNADATRIDIDFRVANQGHTVGRIASFYSTSEYGGLGGLRFFTRSGGSLVENMRINSGGNVGIGTSAPDEKLTVNGKIHAKEVRIDLSIPAPDYVFANDYKLKTLQEVEAYIKENSHLPEIPSAQEIDKNGLMLAEMNMSLLKKIEELTLYAIEQKKKSDQMMKYIETQNKIILQQNIRLEKLEEKKTSSK
nr:tail fiber protein [uncultured Flavobacterium sp.]